MFLQFAFYNKDPRRVQPLVDFIMEEFENVDFNAETTFDVVKVLSFFRAMYEELEWKFSAWSDDVLRRCWSEIKSEHDDVSLRRLLITVLLSRSSGLSVYRGNYGVLRQDHGGFILLCREQRSHVFNSAVQVCLHRRLRPSCGNREF